VATDAGPKLWQHPRMTDLGDGLDASLRTRMEAVGLDPADFGDPSDAWHRLHERFGRRITLLDRYALEAAHRRTRPEELDEDTLDRLRMETLAAQFPGLELQLEAERRDGPLEVVSYDRRWPLTFSTWSDRLARALGPIAVRVEHVGSTSVPGLAAKPIVDIQLSVPDADDEPAYLPALEECSLALRSREPGHRYLRPPAERPREVHLHVCSAGSDWEREHLLFRDYLRTHPLVSAAYGALKFELAGRYPADRLAYTDAKSGFILDALDAAEAWAAVEGWRVGWE
jgi:GrpB-like predicted nucleotidyltransferase (UPF0157 family)